VINLLADVRLHENKETVIMILHNEAVRRNEDFIRFSFGNKIDANAFYACVKNAQLHLKKVTGEFFC